MAANSSTIKNIPTIFPSQFFDIPHPDSPWISVQFRTGVFNQATGTYQLPDNLTDPEQWQEITLNPSNYFDGVTIEDESGFQRIELTLVDQYYTNIETFITRAIAVVNANNQLAQQNSPTQQTAQQFFQFQLGNTSFVNLRIRFGYGTATVNTAENGSVAIDESSFSDNYANRVQGGTVIRSPWIYLQILNVQFKLTEFGLAATISAISTMETWLGKAKMVRRFYVFRDTPTNMLTWFAATIQAQSKGEIDVQYGQPSGTGTGALPGDLPIETPNKDSTGNFIEINLGDEGDEAVAAKNPNYRTVKSFLDELCSKIPPKVVKADQTYANNNGNNLEQSGEETDRSIRYSYMLVPTNSAKPPYFHLTFFYPDPLKNTQPKMRTYVWREYGLSVVRNLEIESRLDFAQLNYPLLVSDKSQSTVGYQVVVAGADKYGRAVSPTEVTAALADKNFRVAFVADQVAVSGATQSLTSLVAQHIVHFLNLGVFNGTITLSGDPFFLFDGSVRPFEYMIKVIILRPGFSDDTGTYFPTQATDQSYLSGYYLIKKISHKIDTSGFITTLDIMRYPLPGET
jgi:hypothetical protein